MCFHIFFRVVDDSCVASPVSAPFRGTHSVYSLGEKPASPPNLRFFSVGSLIAMAIHISMFFAPFFSEPPWDLFCEARSYSYKDISVLQFLKNVWKSGWAESEDIAPYDATYQSVVAREENGEGVANEGTYYTSYATDMVWSQSTIHLYSHTKVSILDGPGSWVRRSFQAKHFTFCKFPVVHPISGDVFLQPKQDPSISRLLTRHTKWGRQR